MNYVTGEQIENAIISEVKTIVRDKLVNDVERILSNTAYSVVWDAVDLAIDGKAKDVIKEKALKIIENVSSYSVFRKKDLWGKDESVAYSTLQSAVEENKNVIRENVKKIIDSYNYSTAINEELITDAVIEIIKSRFQK